MTAWTFTVPGQPVPKGRPRLAEGRVYTPKRTKDYELKVAQYALAAGVRCAPKGQQVGLEIEVCYKRDMDLDNAEKSALDGLNGIAYADDRQVVELISSKAPSLNPRLIVSIHWMEVP